MALSSLPPMPTTSKQRPLRACACGCGGTTQRTFVPGHDARLKGAIIRVVRGLMTLDEVETWGGTGCRKAVNGAIGNAGLMKRWNIEIPEIEEVKVG